jgi:hypothetical protein
MITDVGSNVNPEQSLINVSGGNESKVTLAYPIHKFVYAKPERFNNKLTDWNVDPNFNEIEFIRALRDGKCCLTSKVDVGSTLELQKKYQPDENGKDHGFNRDHIVSTRILPCDFDGASWLEFPENLREYVAIAYATPSAKITNGLPDRFRVIFILPFEIQVNLIHQFREIFFENYLGMFPVAGKDQKIGLDHCVAKPTQIVYGADPQKHGHESVLIYDEDVELSAEIVTELVSLATARKENEDKRRQFEATGNFQNLYRAIYDHCAAIGFDTFLEKYGESVGHDFKPYERHPETDAIAQFDVCSPFTENGQAGFSRSMSIKFLEEGGISVLERGTNEAYSFWNFNCRLNNQKEDGTYISVSQAYQKLKKPENGGEGKFWENLQKFSASTGVTIPKSNTDLVEALSRVLKIKDDGTKEGTFWIYNPNKSIWEKSKNLNQAIAKSKQWLKLKGFNLDEFDITVTKQTRNSKGEPTTKEETKSIDPFAAALRELMEKPELFLGIDDEIFEDPKYTTFLNGSFNLETNELEELEPEQFNLSKNPVAIPENIDPSWADPFIAFNKKWCKSEQDADTLLLNSILAYRRCKHEYLLLTHIVGSSQIGKGVYTESLARPFVEDDSDLYNVQKGSPVVLVAGKNEKGNPTSLNFGEIRKQTRVVFIDECEDYTTSADELKRIANRNSVYVVDEKYIAKYSVLCRFPIVGASEVIPKMPQNFGEGIYNRIKIIDLRHWTNHLMNTTPFDESGLSMMGMLKQTYLDRQACQRFMFWCLKYANKEMIDELYDRVSSNKSDFVTEIENQNAGSDAFDILLAEHFEFTFNEDDAEFTEDLIKVFDQIENLQECRGYDNRRRGTTGKTFNKRLEQYLQRNSHDDYMRYQALKELQKNAQGKPKQRKHPDKKTMCPVIWGIKRIGETPLVF